LAQREKIGGEGSRRRQRHDNGKYCLVSLSLRVVVQEWTCYVYVGQEGVAYPSLFFIFVRFPLSFLTFLAEAHLVCCPFPESPPSLPTLPFDPPLYEN
jgi:hypothetical protein